MGHDNFKKQFQRSVIRKTLIALLAVSVTVAFAGILPLSRQLRAEQAKNIAFAAKTKCMVVEEFLSKARETSLQFTSRSKIRDMLERYNRGEVGGEELKRFTEPKILDAMKLSDVARGVSRLDKRGELVATVGMPMPPGMLLIPESTSREPLVDGPLRLDGGLYLVIGAPIINRQGERVGTDNVIFTMERLRQIVGDYTGLGLSGESILGRLVGGEPSFFFAFRDIQGKHSHEMEGQDHEASIKEALRKASAPADDSGAGLVESPLHLVAYERVPGVDWVLMVRMDKDELFAPLNSQIRVVVAIIFCLILFGLLGMLLLLRPLAGKAIVHTDQLHREILDKTRALKERDQIEKKLHAEREQLEVTLRSINEGVVTVDNEDRIQLLNPVAERLTGWNQQEAADRDFAEVVAIFDAATRRQGPLSGEKALNGAGKGERGTPLTLVGRDRRERQVYISGAPIYDGEGRKCGGVFILLDVTDQQRLEAQLRQSSKMEAVGRLAGGVAHDFNNLLTVIIGHGTLLDAGLGVGNPLRKHLEAITIASENAAALTRQLLAFSRKQVVEMRPIDLNRVVQNLGKMLHLLIGSANVELELRPGSDTRPIMADPGQIEQILMNLAVNAKDAMPEGGRLVISTEAITLDQRTGVGHGGLAAGDYLLLAVSDTGHGMRPEVRERIFEPFFTTKAEGKGTGLGLATVYGIVRQLKALINVYSEPGHGTTFKIYFPIVDEGQLRPGEPDELKPPGGNEAILVVEDDENIRQLIVEILKPLGYQVTVAGDGQEALAVVERGEAQFDLLLTDVVMPGINGCELARRVNELRPRVRIVYMSGYTDHFLNRQCMVKPGIAFISKPLVPDVLARRLREVLDREEASSPALPDDQPAPW